MINILQAIQQRKGNGTPLQYSCLENPMDGRAWQAVVHGVAKSRTRLRDLTFTFHFHALKEMASHSSTLAWRIPGTWEPGGLPSMGHTELDTTKATQQQQQQQQFNINCVLYRVSSYKNIILSVIPLKFVFFSMLSFLDDFSVAFATASNVSFLARSTSKALL